MNYLNSDEWLIMDNILLGDINNFGLSIMMGVVQNEDDNPILIGEDGLSFVLTVYDRTERKKTECVFPSFEETAFFINSYLIECHSIIDVSACYMNYCLSMYNTKNKGYN